mmetsp:Transcript_113965/g.285102  ORF Transcript_113965/g.285102 Transcript_113965/m.285102 type:complete len:253 (+) Transcript_113965:367-1125(+)
MQRRHHAAHDKHAVENRVEALDFRDPPDELANFPVTLSAQALGGGHGSGPILLAGHPLTIVGAAIRPCDHALPLLLPLTELALVYAAVRPPHCPMAMHLVPLPHTVVVFSIGPHIATIAVHVVPKELALIHATFTPHELPMAMLPALFEISSKHRAISPALNAVAVLKIATPLALIARGLDDCTASRAGQAAVALLDILHVLALKHRSIGISVLCDAMLLAVAELTLVQGSVDEPQFSLSVELSALPLAKID